MSGPFLDRLIQFTYFVVDAFSNMKTKMQKFFEQYLLLYLKHLHCKMFVVQFVIVQPEPKMALTCTWSEIHVMLGRWISYLVETSWLGGEVRRKKPSRISRLLYGSYKLWK